MAQKREKEETELKLPICTPPPIQKLAGSEDPAFRLPENCSDLKLVDPRPTSAKSPESVADRPGSEEKAENKLKRKWVNRCSGCNKKVGLMGFRCRCGDMFCSEHRYSDRHDCSFDYKAAGREAIARENPVVRAPKILKV